jgi:ribose-phosphate pyrophosphokinase
MDLHAGQIQGFFNIPVDHLYASPVLMKYFGTLEADGIVVVSPDAGGVERARAYAKRINATLAIIDKRRERANVSQVMNVIGDVKGKVAVILDDIVDTAGTLTQAVPELLERGALRVHGMATHGVLSGPAIERIKASALVGIGVTDTIQLHPAAAKCEKISVFSVDELLGEAIRRIHNEDSVSTLFI